jgi:hypothetical protein
MKLFKYILFSFFLSISTIVLRASDYFEKVVERSMVVSLYPNPVVNGNVLTINTEKEINKIQVLNIVGQLMRVEGEIQVTNAKVSINDLKKGIYIIKILFVDNSSSTTRLWVK